MALGNYNPPSHPKEHGNDAKMSNSSRPSDCSPQITEDQEEDSEGGLITFDRPRKFSIGEMTQTAVEGDHFGDAVNLPTGAVPQTQTSRKPPRKMVIFSVPTDFKIKSADFLSVNGNLYGASIPKSQSRREGGHLQPNAPRGRKRKENTGLLSPSQTPSPPGSGEGPDALNIASHGGF